MTKESAWKVIYSKLNADEKRYIKLQDFWLPWVIFASMWTILIVIPWITNDLPVEINSKSLYVFFDWQFLVILIAQIPFWIILHIDNKLIKKVLANTSQKEST